MKEKPLENLDKGDSIYRVYTMKRSDFGDVLKNRQIIFHVLSGRTTGVQIRA
jgi:hypothetical protein